MDRTSRRIAVDTWNPDDRRTLIWARRIARDVGGQVISSPTRGARRCALDFATKREVDWLVTELRWSRGVSGIRQADTDLGLLIHRAPCPVLTIQPWVEAPSGRLRVAVVGMNDSASARAAARAAVALLATQGDAGRKTLILVHGTETHPAELAARTPWRALVAQMDLEHQAWLRVFAGELRTPELGVDIVTKLSWAPDLIGGVARCAEVDFVALGAARRAEGEAAELGDLHARMVRAIPCPLLTASTPS